MRVLGDVIGDVTTFSADWSGASVFTQDKPDGEKQYQAATLHLEIPVIGWTFSQSQPFFHYATAAREGVSPHFFDDVQHVTLGGVRTTTPIEDFVAAFGLEGLYIGADHDAQDDGDGSTVRVYGDQDVGDGQRQVSLVATLYKVSYLAENVVTVFATCTYAGFR